MTFEYMLRLFLAWGIVSTFVLCFGNRIAELSRKNLIGMAWRFLAYWLLFSVLGVIYGKQLLTPFLPSLSTLINLIQQEYSASLIITDRPSFHIQLTGTMNSDLPPLVKGDQLSTFANLMHFVVPSVFFYALMLAWPINGLRKRIGLLLLTTPTILLFTALTLPFQLVAFNEHALQKLAAQSGSMRADPWLLTWAKLVEDTGGWLQAFAIAIVGSIALQNTFTITSPKAQK
ncbi:hypothetical protein [Methylomonas methanica]|uniref:Uncharacterized protein n=1 Tax=Methylomonas methanica (strain DSM 25384 / MC09) TaxID=857087 RepID=F9ZVM0_METMM|nr:hypothetical protein [Methylomonas methanica]AEG02002.1 hypothetical protein Metme_3641 [Methylomonas methanica MC09]